ncbi:fimbriae usher protein, partial [Stenotrophomonas sp. HMWF022]
MVGRSLRPCLRRRRLAEACMLACCTGLASVSVHGAGRGLPAPATDIAAEASLPAPTPLTAPQALYLDTSLNQAQRGLMLFHEQGGRLQAPASTLRQLGFPVRGDAPVYLDQIPQLIVHYDASLQVLDLHVPLQQLQLPVAQLGRGIESAPAAQASPGMAVNYDVYASHSNGLGNVSLNSDVRLFGFGNGTLRNTALMRSYQLPGEGWQQESVRLDTSWRLDLPEQALTLTVGDFYSGFLEWSRPARMAGVQIGRNYGLQPYRVLTPTPAFLGEAVVPSSVELYIDGLRQYTGQVPVGPFQLAAQPGINGTGTAQVVVTDAFGRMQTLDFAFYGTQQLLAAGLSDWSAGLG